MMEVDAKKELDEEEEGKAKTRFASTLVGQHHPKVSFLFFSFVFFFLLLIHEIPFLRHCCDLYSVSLSLSLYLPYLTPSISFTRQVHFESILLDQLIKHNIQSDKKQPTPFSMGGGGSNTSLMHLTAVCITHAALIQYFHDSTRGRTLYAHASKIMSILEPLDYIL